MGKPKHRRRLKKRDRKMARIEYIQPQEARFALSQLVPLLDRFPQGSIERQLVQGGLQFWQSELDALVVTDDRMGGKPYDTAC